MRRTAEAPALEEGFDTTPHIYINPAILVGQGVGGVLGARDGVRKYMYRGKGKSAN
jgi:hypothetical protein